MKANDKFQLLCDGKKAQVTHVVNRCCPGECIAGPDSPITRFNKIK